MGRSAARLLDEYLVAAAKTGDRKSMELLAERWNRKLVAHAWRLTGDIECARDAAQSAWMEIIRGLGHLHDERAFPAWAFRILSRRCAREIDAAVRRRSLVGALEAEPPKEQPENFRDDLDRVRSAISLLPPAQKAAIGLYYLEEMSVAEIAVALAVPAGTVKTRLMHARRRLRAELEGDEECVISTS